MIEYSLGEPLDCRCVRKVLVLEEVTKSIIFSMSFQVDVNIHMVCTHSPVVTFVLITCVAVFEVKG